MSLKVSCSNKEIIVLKGELSMQLCKETLSEDTEFIEESQFNLITVNSILPFAQDYDDSSIKDCFIGDRSPQQAEVFSDETFEPKNYFPSALNLVDSLDPIYGKLVDIVQNKQLDLKRIGDLMRSTQLYNGIPRPDDVVASNIEAFSGFLTLLGFLCIEPSIIKNLLKDRDHYTSGRASVRLFIDCKWTSVVVDDRVPMFVEIEEPHQNIPTNNSVASRSLRYFIAKSTLCCYALKHRSWVSMLQKAYSKAFNSYLHITGQVDPEICLRDLTGCPVYRRCLDNISRVQDCAEVARYVDQGFIVLLDCKDLPVSTGIDSFASY